MKKVLWVLPVAALALSTAALWVTKKKSAVRKNYLGV